MSNYCTTVARRVNLSSRSHKSLTGFSWIYEHESFVPLDGLEVHPPEKQHGSSSCPHLSVINRLARHESRVYKAPPPETPEIAAPSACARRRSFLL